MTENNRREFLKSSSLSIAGGAFALAGSSWAAGANNRLTVGVIGSWGMGRNHVRLLAENPEVNLAYLCDVDANRLGEAAKLAEETGGKSPKLVKDMRTVFDDQDVDAVFIATPDHWHGPATLLAVAAGKHVYSEKPCAHNLREGRLMVEAARQHNKVVQIGTQSRSTEHVQRAMELLKDGAIGDILVAKAWNSQKRRSIGHEKPSTPPKELNYDLWIGPAPMVPYQANLLPGVWRWWHAFGTGDMGNDGVHDIDIARWGLGVNTHPTRITAIGGKYFFNDDQQFPDTQYVVFEYGESTLARSASKGQPKPKQLIFEQRIWSPYVQEGHENGDAFYGTEGMLILGKANGWKLYGPRNQLREEMKGSPDLAAHHRNFLNCVRNDSRPNADVEIGHLSSALCHLGNISTRMGRMLHFDPRAETILDDDAAALMLKRKYREGHWATPKGV